MGLSSDKGVFRELKLSSNMTDEDLRALTYEEVLSLDMENSAVVDYRLNRFGPDVVLVWDGMRLSNSIWMRLQSKGVSVVYDLHNEWLESNNYELDPWYWWWKKQTSVSARLRKCWMTVTGQRRRILRKLPAHDASNLDFAHAWCASASLRDKLVADGIVSLAECPVIHSAMNPSGLVRKEDYGKNLRFIWAGRLSEAKAPDLALEAVAKLHEQGVPVSLDIYGMGEPIERKTFRESIIAMGLIDSVKMIGIRPGEMGERYSQYDALLFTSRSEDPFPMTPMEAMWSGLPCIVSNNGGIREVIEDGETAIMFESGNAEALVAAIQRFLAIPDAGEQLASKCIDRLQAEYSMATYLDKVEEVLSSAVASKH